MIVTRCPISHPSCIRKLKAVAAPKLNYLFDVIVFSTKGDRPAQNMMSGGDLDGDIYFVSWDTNLVSQVTEVDPPCEAPPRDESLSEPIAKYEVASNITYYLKNDCLGSVSNLHLAWCDYVEETKGKKAIQDSIECN